MSAVATAIIGGAVIGGGVSYMASKSASKSAEKAAETEAAGEAEALAYLKEVEALPLELREDALRKLGGLYGLEGGEGSQQELIDRAKTSPLYAEIMGGLETGEESIMRHATATGGLRSGGTSEALAKYGTELKSKALLSAYSEEVSGLLGMSGLPSGAGEIAGLTSSIGETLAEGKIASARAKQEGAGQVAQTVLGMGTNLVKHYSDPKLKKNIRKTGYKKGLNWYTWDWNLKGNALGLFGTDEGYMATEVLEKFPHSVSHINGYLAIDYTSLEV